MLNEVAEKPALSKGGSKMSSQRSVSDWAMIRSLRFASEFLPNGGQNQLFGLWNQGGGKLPRSSSKTNSGQKREPRGSDQFAPGISSLSITNTSAGAFTRSSLSPICSWMAVNNPGGASGEVVGAS